MWLLLISWYSQSSTGEPLIKRLELGLCCMTHAGEGMRLGAIPAGCPTARRQGGKQSHHHVAPSSEAWDNTQVKLSLVLGAVAPHGIILWQKHRNSIGHSCGIAAASCNINSYFWESLLAVWLLNKPCCQGRGGERREQRREEGGETGSRVQPLEHHAAELTPDYLYLCVSTQINGA